MEKRVYRKDGVRKKAAAIVSIRAKTKERLRKAIKKLDITDCDIDIITEAVNEWIDKREADALGKCTSEK